jgi:hypothetical protein
MGFDRVGHRACHRHGPLARRICGLGRDCSSLGGDGVQNRSGTLQDSGSGFARADLVSLRLGCSKWFRDLTTVRTYVTLFLIAHTLILSQKIFPLMDRAKAAGNMTLFDSLHHFYEHMSYFALLMLVVIIVLTAMRNSRHYDE